MEWVNEGGIERIVFYVSDRVCIAHRLPRQHVQKEDRMLLHEIWRQRKYSALVLSFQEWKKYLAKCTQDFQKIVYKWFHNLSILLFIILNCSKRLKLSVSQQCVCVHTIYIFACIHVCIQLVYSFACVCAPQQK